MGPTDAKDIFPDFRAYRQAFMSVAKEVLDAAPKMRERMIIAGTGAISTIHTAHRASWDLDLHGIELGTKTTPLVNQLRRTFGRRLSLNGDETTGMYQGELTVDRLPPISLDIFPAADPLPYSYYQPLPSLGIGTFSLAGYAEAKARSLVERDDYKDFYDLAAVHGHSTEGAKLVDRWLMRRCSVEDMAIISLYGTPGKLERSGFAEQPRGFLPVTEDNIQSLMSTIETVSQRKKALALMRESDGEDRRVERQFSGYNR